MLYKYELNRYDNNNKKKSSYMLYKYEARKSTQTMPPTG